MKTIKSLIYIYVLFVSLHTDLFAIDLPEFKASLSSGLKRPLTIYNNWSAYDELSDNIPQTEELSLKMLDEMIRLKKRGVQLDCYLMDAFWFDVDGGYRIWHKRNWPDGPGQWLEKCKENGIIPGLWFSTNLIQSGGKPMLNPIPEWKESQTSDHSILSLFEGGYLEHLMETLQMYTDMGFGVFKFDFAYFDAASDYAKATMLPTEIVEANKQAFIRAVKKFRAKNPNVVFIAYNGFGGDMENTTTSFRKTVDPRWLEIFDTLYSGDPRFSDVPMMNVWRSQDLYSDHMVRQFAFNGLPLSRIDNCSFMIGETGTCYNRGIAAWKSSLVLNLARGGWLNVYHGNIDLLNDADADWFAKVQKMYLQLQQFGQTSLIGGIPGKTQIYGYKAVSAEGCLVTIVNPSQRICEVELSSAPYEQGRILFTDKGFTPQLNAGKLTMGAEQMAVIGLGRYASEQYDLGVEEDVVIPRQIEQLVISPQMKDAHTVEFQIADFSDKLRIVFSQLDLSGKPIRSWGGGLPEGVKMNEYLAISVKQGKKNVPVKINYDKIIWSGLSWGAGEIDIKDLKSNSPLKITCCSKEGESKNFKIDVYNVVY